MNQHESVISCLMSPPLSSPTVHLYLGPFFQGCKTYGRYPLMFHSPCAIDIDLLSCSSCTDE